MILGGVVYENVRGVARLFRVRRKEERSGKDLVRPRSGVLLELVRVKEISSSEIGVSVNNACVY
jgi:hypothetical protein